MDSILNQVYNTLKSQLNVTEKERLKKEQKAWLKRRDVFIAKQNKEFLMKQKKGEWGSEMYMITYENDAEFVKERILILIKRLEKE